MTFYQFTKKSSNAKTGPIPVTTTSNDTCPDACPLKRNGCYADGGPLRMHWDKVSRGERGIDLAGFCNLIESLPDSALWRMNQAGDLPGNGDSIDGDALADIVSANNGRKGFTYTHKPPTHENQAAINWANFNGFTINLSANNLEQADELAGLNVGPVVTILPSDSTENTTTPSGARVVVCPATQRDNVTCSSCGLCQKQNRPIIGFPAHGSSHKKASAVANG